MKRSIIILTGLLCLLLDSSGQKKELMPAIIQQDSTISLPSPVVLNDSIELQDNQEEKADQIIRNYDHLEKPDVHEIDTTKRINYWRITERTGEIIPAYPDTFLTDYPNRTIAEGYGVSMAYTGNLGAPMESRIFTERPERSNFMFFDHLYPYTRSPYNFNYINTKIPYSNISYNRGGGRENREERFNGQLSVNFGKSLNVGIDVSYLYARGFYQSQAVKHTDWVLYSSYITDRHRLHVFINPTSYTNTENGGIVNDEDITQPELNSDISSAADIQTNFTDTWNRLKSNRYFFNYRYNLGFEKDSNRKDDEGNIIKDFIPVSSIIYTFDYLDSKRHFDTNSLARLDTLYLNGKEPYFQHTNGLNDSTSFRQISNTLALSLREGFSPWAKFDLTAFLSHDFRKYTLMDTTSYTYKRLATEEERNDTGEDSINVIGYHNYNKNYNTIYIGGEIAKRSGKFIRMEAKGKYGIGYNKNDYDLSGYIETRIPLLGDTASLTGIAYIKGTKPSFYEQNFRGRYHWWSENDKKFSKVKKRYFGGELNIPHTRSKIKAGVENIENYIYFNTNGTPVQYNKNVNILTVSLKQNFQFKALHWDNDIVYQNVTEGDNVLPLPDLSLYSNLYITFKVAKVLTIQMGGNVHYFTEYESPTYDPVTMQYKLQQPDANGEIKKVGNYPLINGYINCHLKYTRFYVQFYNLGEKFINKPAYFSLPHYPVNPMFFKFGLSWDFHN